MTQGEIDWSQGAPRSVRFGDIYFAPEDGLAESRAVFLDGLDLPRAWSGRRRFVVGELGFGTGLNVLALLQRWAEFRPADARLHVVSVEAFPLAPGDAALALAAWPELASLAAPMLARWPQRRGVTRLDWPGLNASLDLMVMEADAALRAWDGAADAWMLGGFAPAANPAMWTPELMALVAAHSAPAARAATFTVAGAVRRALAEAGFAVEKRPGHGRKRQRLEARLPGAPPPEPPPLRVAVVGGGIAGAALARALRREGAQVVLVEAQGLGAGASGNAAALVTPRLDSGFGSAAALHAQAFARAVDLYDAETPDAGLARGALQLERAPRDAARFDRLVAWDGFRSGSLRRFDRGEAAAALGEAAAPAALGLDDARVVEPAAVLARWSEGAEHVAGRVAALEPLGAGWRLRDAEGGVLVEADAVVVAAGPEAAALIGAPLEPVRGQVSIAETPFKGAPVAGGGYAIPTRTGVLFGASHGRGDADVDPRPAEAARNLADLAAIRPTLAQAVATAPKAERAAVRAATPDRSPLASAWPGAPGLWVLGGLGGRGFTLAPLLAEHVAAQVAGAPSPLPLPLQALVDPARFGTTPSSPRSPSAPAARKPIP